MDKEISNLVLSGLLLRVSSFDSVDNMCFAASVHSLIMAIGGLEDESTITKLNYES